MRLKIIFGNESNVEELSWNKDIQDFPKLIEYKKENYSWFMYDKSEDPWVEYILHFSKVPQYDRDYFAKALTMDEVRDFWRRTDCECGAEKIFGKVTGHSFWCPKWRKM